MKFDDRFKQIINEWRYTDDPARDYDEYEKEERERLETEFIKENIAKNTSSYNVSFIPFQNDYKIIVNGKETEIHIEEKMLIDANISSDDILHIGDIELHYKIRVDNFDADDYYVDEILDEEPLDFTVVRSVDGSKRELDEKFYDTSLFDNILEAIRWYFGKYHSPSEILDDWTAYHY